MSGRLFVARGDITQMRCDAWLLPCDAALQVNPVWHKKAPASFRWPTASQGRRLDDTERRTLPLEPWTKALGTAPAPIPILTNTGANENESQEWYRDGLTQFVNHASRCAPKTSWRVKRLFAVPMIGTGLGGQAHDKGGITVAIVETLEHLAAKCDVDIVLVAWTEAAYSAVQRRRRPSLDTDSAELLDTANRLALLARSGELVLFLGAGISQPAGVPLWRDLVFQVAKQFNVTSLEDVEAVKDLSVLDIATIAETGASNALAFKAAIAAASQAPLYALGHALTSSLGVRESVTTNYDQLYENAVRATHRDLSVLPESPRQDGSAWLLKLHGCVTLPDSIVITRQDYMRYHGTRSALQGIVQALLITRHIMFVGFSLSDENFHVVVDAVRQAVDGGAKQQPQRRHFGTALFLNDSQASRTLWKRDIDVVGISPAGASIPEAARNLEIFLDYVAWRATSAGAHLLDDTYELLLSETDRKVKAKLRELEAAVDATDPNATEYAPIRDLLHRYGAAMKPAAPFRE